jgi:hypothetical protein
MNKGLGASSAARAGRVTSPRHPDRVRRRKLDVTEPAGSRKQRLRDGIPIGDKDFSGHPARAGDKISRQTNQRGDR